MLLVPLPWAISLMLTVAPSPAVAGVEYFPRRETGQFLMREIATEHGTRKYKLYIPGNYDGSREFPLIVMLHGCTQDPDDIARGTRLNEAAEAKSVMVAYPEQPATANARKCWNWYESAHQTRGEGEPRLIAAITQQVMADYRVDSRRVYVAGLSAGAAMAVTVALLYPEVYAAVGSHSGIPFGAATSVTEALNAMQGKDENPEQLASKARNAMGGGRRAMPAIVFQGANDHVVSVTNSIRIADQLEAVQSPMVGDQRLRAPGDMVESAGGYHYTRGLRGTGKGDIELWVVEELGHAWSGGSASGTFTDEKGPSATDEMLRFFLAHPHSHSGPAT